MAVEKAADKAAADAGEQWGCALLMMQLFVVAAAKQRAQQRQVQSEQQSRQQIQQCLPAAACCGVTLHRPCSCAAISEHCLT